MLRSSSNVEPSASNLFHCVVTCVSKKGTCGFHTFDEQDRHDHAQGDETFYAMFHPSMPRGPPVRVDQFPMGSEHLNELMPKVMQASASARPSLALVSLYLGQAAYNCCCCCGERGAGEFHLAN